MRAKADQEETANVAIVVLSIDFSHVAVPVGSHQHVQLLPERIHRQLLLSLSLLGLFPGFAATSSGSICNMFTGLFSLESPKNVFISPLTFKPNLFHP